MKGSSCKLLILLLSISLVTSQRSCLDEFLQCLPLHSNPSYPIANAIHTAHNASFQHLYELHAVNLRILSSPSTSKPLAIITALHASHAQAAVVCAKHHKLQLRIRSGGHDYEGLSYTSDVPFFILDLFNLRSIKVDVATETAWVQAGATTGELYYRIAEKSGVHGFPSGVCTTLGIGGHFSGGGYGNMMRKYGLSIDNVVDAHLIDANGMIRNRKSMGEDVFWAIRGGGGTSFGIILSWKIKLVRVPRKESNSKFRELGLNLSDCKEMSWAESTLFWAGYPNGTSIDTLLQRVQGNKVFFKTKSDYYKKVIPKQGLEMLWELLMEIGNVFMQLNPHGGRMEEIPESETAYPQRAGYLFKTQYTIHWTDSDGGIGAAEKHVRMSRRLYRTMASYASSNPREAFVNYRDLDIGSNGSNDTDFSVARVYGTKYFKKNFMRLARVKAMADPDNFFKNEQSIRPLPSH
ncbi:Inactive tetrahydrocannabinolic acid synthase [Hibiscus syriacus]|uniref:Inactive tetrahydrocannabinolic acid synthase n=1 Tax=Hibiscus syriacus TaxID=106335 RepID=A0A6A3D5E0_HIBSY|nr:Inactive tetrahydrocannabinolic acid synthase [Hibiscus syriacus]